MDIKDRINQASIQSDQEKNLRAKFAGKPGQKAPWLSEAKEKKLKESCKDFEAVFTNMMLQSMRKTLPGDSLFGKSLASDIFQSMYDQNLASQISKNGEGLGLSGMAYKDLKTKITGVHEAPVKPPSKFYRDVSSGFEVNEKSETGAVEQKESEQDDDLKADLFSVI
ncbi:rod-binding protein [Desulforegula conservatrix]|uniref:rod-binding protein n=1 Tax=Desulforegula conservatrix TaxID=153026 RepID=UPI0003FF93F4|nr:rod-binding protein [Desulforegula conservatrix]